MNKHEKQVISYSELLKKVQGLLAFYPECKNISIDSIQVHQEQSDGANWHVSNFRISGDDNDLPECKSKIISEIVNLRQCYDVAEE